MGEKRVLEESNPLVGQKPRTAAELRAEYVKVHSPLQAV